MSDQMLKVGDYNELEVIDKVDGRFIMDSSQGRIPLICDLRGVDIQIGEVHEVFIYNKAKGDLVATLSTPYAVLGEFAAMTVVDKNDFGAYLDWGIEQDLFVFKKEQSHPLSKGMRCVVYVIEHEKSGNIQGSTFLENRFNEDTSKLKPGDRVNLLVYRLSDIGIMAIVNNEYSGMLYKNECFENAKVGDFKVAYIKKVREDGKLDLTLQPQIAQAIASSKAKIIARLKDADNGFLPYHDKSDPEDIKSIFGMSKKNFKKAIGGLYKDHLVNITDKGITLLESP